ncbi:MAG TPA: hypothetical protein PLD20_28580 [Blastocatellia bacterium]|nr:hypothetical protein [Blastocatellia bacterium]HMV84230.1 hypothetical protein [Blastocatellia bacterium]HMX26998.1 hypothetical protein [Blastocatellia bacterium]HMY72483.1 hypothetical protein [Blastocatellia bacterium]HMZ21923.1 hypothetical protein [Blastocatellia bacterium]
MKKTASKSTVSKTIKTRRKYDFDLAVMAAQRTENEKLEAEQCRKLAQAWNAAGERSRAMATAEEALKLADANAQELAEEVRRKLEGRRASSASTTDPS